MNSNLQLLVYYKVMLMLASPPTCFLKERAVAYAVHDRVVNVSITTCAKTQLQWLLHLTILRASLRFKSDRVEVVKDQPQLFAHQSLLMPWLHPQLWLIKSLKYGGVDVGSRCKSYQLLSCFLEITIKRHLKVVEYSQVRRVRAPSPKLIASIAWAKLKSMTIMSHPHNN